MEGKIIHRLQLDERCSNIKKRKRDERPTIKRSQSRAELWESSGLVFIPNDTSLYDEFQLCVPQELLKEACDASVNQQSVVITNYKIVPIMSTLRPNPNKLVAMLEIHSGGLKLKGTIHCFDEPSISDVWTLSQFHRREVVVEETIQAERKRQYNIVATVDAITPIISMDANDPFALVELYDRNSPPERTSTCVLVLTSARDLLYHSAIFPGDEIILQRIRRKRWPLSETLREDKKGRYHHLVKRIPRFVFASNEESRIRWQRSPAIPPIPPTVLPLVSLEGEIGHVQTTSIPSTSVICPHWIEILDIQGKNTFKLYVTHFPMSTTLQLGLQKGAIIRAVNIHKLYDPLPVSDNEYLFGACLRSTITIVKLASDPSKGRKSTFSNNDTAPVDDEDNLEMYQTQPPPAIDQIRLLDESVNLSTQGLVPYRLNQISCSYHDHIHKRHITEWIHRNFAQSSSFEFLSLPSVSTLIDFLGQQGTKKQVSKVEATKGKSKRTPTRDPYAEFFDHGDDDVGRAPASIRACGCKLSRHDTRNQSASASFIGLMKIRSTSLRIFTTRLSRLFGQKKAIVKARWTGSIYLDTGDLLSEISGDHNPHLPMDHRLFTGGHVTEFRTDRTTPASISDKHCQIPVTFSKASAVVKGDFVVGCIRKVIVSCFCVFQSKTVGHSQGIDKNLSFRYAPLSPLKPAYFNDESLVGGCTLVRVGDSLLLVSVQIVCDGDPTSFGSPRDQKNSDSTSKHNQRVESIEACLSSPAKLMDVVRSFDSVKGLLLRQRYVHSRVNHKSFSQCCVLTLCNIPTNRTIDATVPSDFHLQSIDMKLSISCTANNLARFKETLVSLCDDFRLVADSYVLGTAWWALADSGRTCAVVSGGWDELEDPIGFLRNENVVTLSLPSSSLKVANRGYVRCSCYPNEIEATFAALENGTDLNDVSHSPSKTRLFDCLGGRRIYDGMLNKRPRRRQVFGPNATRTVGKLTHVPQTPKVALSDLFRLLCCSLRNDGSDGISPSLVYHLSNSQFLGVVFCQVQCICLTCFEPLKDPRPAKMKDTDEDADEVSFWHLPAPGEPEAIPASTIPRHILESKLRCPNQHPPEAYQVLWECSGVLDDGTGQAKLYAERDAALTLLGMNASTIETIEKAIWSTSSGTICFNKSIPPPLSLKKRIQGVQHLTDPLSRLPPRVRAEYLLQHHCRSSDAPQQPSDYFVRCKPLSDEIKHLNHTMAESSFVRDAALVSQEVATYSLPPLKLVLVDVACPTTENQFPDGLD
eukprot:scaffold3389_cov119-Cylindrotheca_fusiformis.AAC.3